MFVSVRSPVGEAVLVTPAHAVTYDDGYCFVELNESERGLVERLEGDGPGVNVLAGEDVIWRRGALSFRNGAWCLRWDPKNVKCYFQEG